MIERLAHLDEEYKGILDRLADPEVFSDQRALVDLSRRAKELEPIVTAHRRYLATQGDLAAAKEMLADSTGDDRQFVRDQIEDSEATLAALEQELRLLLLPKDPNDDKNVIIEIRGAEGGEEANLFGKDLFEMYSRYAERQGWKLEVLAADPSDMGGFNEVTFLLKGDGVWRRMKHEAGPHRV
ncbi:MAG TPA: PCRF domain-containing protein, partial [Acidimicrobiales bacterium]